MALKTAHSPSLQPVMPLRWQSFENRNGWVVSWNAGLLVTNRRLLHRNDLFNPRVVYSRSRMMSSRSRVTGLCPGVPHSRSRFICSKPRTVCSWTLKMRSRAPPHVAVWRHLMRLAEKNLYGPAAVRRVTRTALRFIHTQTHSILRSTSCPDFQIEKLTLPHWPND